MTRIVAFPADVTGCGLMRLVYVCEHLAAEGYDVACYEPGHPKRLQATLKKWPDGSEHVDQVVDPHADVCVFQRPLNRIMVEAMAEMRRCGTKIVVELDDDFRAVSPRNSAFSHVHPATSPDSNWRHLDRAVRNCDLLTVTTPNLAKRYGRHCETVVLPNFIPQRYLDIHVDKTGPPVVGWPGAVATHPDDLPVAARGIADAIRATPGSTFRVVGPIEGVQRQMCGVVAGATGWVSPVDYPHRVAELDVGIAPLEDSTFNRSKSALKCLELASLGVPFVASPRADYQRLADLGIGRLAEGRSAWKWNVRELLQDAELRAAEAKRNRELVVEHELTIESQAHRWWEAWSALV